VVGRRRTKDTDLPRHVYRHNGWFRHRVGKKGKWTKLAPLDDYAGMLTALGKLLEKGTPLNTVELLWASYQNEELPKLAKKTQQNRRNDMKWPLHSFGKVDPAIIEPHHIWTYWKKRGETEQARHEIRALSALLTYARQTGARKDENPCFKLGMKGAAERTIYVTDAMFYAVHDVAPPMIQYAMRLMWCAGLDGATVRKLERRNVTKTGLLFERGKTKKLQQIDGPDLVQILTAALAERPQLRRFVICTHKGGAFSADGFQTAWQRAVTKAIELGRLTPGQRFHAHDIRAKAASESASDKAASNLLGHADEKVTVHHYRRLPQRSEAVPIRVANVSGDSDKSAG
jgi:integrase